MQERDPTYALADLAVQSCDVPHDKIVDEIVRALAGHLGVGHVCADMSAQGDHGS
jgi:shikimate kinase